jgi:hypothetical protein
MHDLGRDQREDMKFCMSARAPMRSGCHVNSLPTQDYGLCSKELEPHKRIQFDLQRQSMQRKLGGNDIVNPNKPQYTPKL